MAKATGTGVDADRQKGLDRLATELLGGYSGFMLAILRDTIHSLKRGSPWWDEQARTVGMSPLSRDEVAYLRAAIVRICDQRLES